MDKIKTFVVQDGELIIDQDTTTKLTDEYIELIPKDCIVRSLRFFTYCQGYKTTNPTPFVLINGETCPIMTQRDYEIESTEKFEITSFKINQDFFLGNITMILVPDYVENLKKTY